MRRTRHDRGLPVDAARTRRRHTGGPCPARTNPLDRLIPGPPPYRTAARPPPHLGDVPASMPAPEEVGPSIEGAFRATFKTP